MEAPPVQYVTTSDGYSIAYCVSGEGPPLVFLPLGLNHIQLAWKQDGRISDWLQELASRFRLVQYDSRGEGMSQRGLDPIAPHGGLRDGPRSGDAAPGAGTVVLLGYFLLGARGAALRRQTPGARAGARPGLELSLLISAWPLDSLLRLAEQNWEAMLYNWVPPTATPQSAQPTSRSSRRRGLRPIG